MIVYIFTPLVLSRLSLSSPIQSLSHTSFSTAFHPGIILTKSILFLFLFLFHRRAKAKLVEIGLPHFISIDVDVDVDVGVDQLVLSRVLYTQKHTVPQIFVGPTIPGSSSSSSSGSSSSSSSGSGSATTPNGPDNTDNTDKHLCGLVGGCDDLFSELENGTFFSRLEALNIPLIPSLPLLVDVDVDTKNKIKEQGEQGEQGDSGVYSNYRYLDIDIDLDKQGSENIQYTEKEGINMVDIDIDINIVNSDRRTPLGLTEKELITWCNKERKSKSTFLNNMDFCYDNSESESQLTSSAYAPVDVEASPPWKIDSNSNANIVTTALSAATATVTESDSDFDSAILLSLSQRIQHAALTLLDDFSNEEGEGGVFYTI